MMDIDSMIAVLQAAKAGKRIQIRSNHGWKTELHWSDRDNTITWNFEAFDYRVKPEPREWWLVQSKIEENYNVHAFRDLRDAENYNLGYWGKKPIKVREVIE
jgi:DNA polymerase III delta prime subunit